MSDPAVFRAQLLPGLRSIPVPELGILSLAKTVTIKSPTRPKCVRVRNSAGDWSRWLKLRGSALEQPRAIAR